MNCDVCGEKIINPDRSWPKAGLAYGGETAENARENVYVDGRLIQESHLGCYRLARGLGLQDRLIQFQRHDRA